MDRRGIDETLKRIQEAVDAGDYDTARTILDSALARRPKEKRLLLSSGDLHRRKSAWREAVKAYAQALEIDPDDEEVKSKLNVTRRTYRIGVALVAFFVVVLPPAIFVLAFVDRNFAFWFFAGWTFIPLLVGLTYLGSGYYRLGGAIVGGLSLALLISWLFDVRIGIVVLLAFTPVMMRGARLETEAKKKLSPVANLLVGTLRRAAEAIAVIATYSVGYWTLIQWLPLTLDDNTKWLSFMLPIPAFLALIFQRRRDG